MMATLKEKLGNEIVAKVSDTTMLIKAQLPAQKKYSAATN
jgi:hypothetical protein